MYLSASQRNIQHTGRPMVAVVCGGMAAKREEIAGKPDTAKTGRLRK
ncbi:hypothetical protein N9917_00870 [Deltaproteobacteria bacterium]|nr:hypothetical protein [Deltaproteobacteria bacterium]